MSEELEAQKRVEKHLKWVYSIKNCHRCGKPFKEGDERCEGMVGIVCKECFYPDIKEGCEKLNRFFKEKMTQ